VRHDHGDGCVAEPLRLALEEAHGEVHRAVEGAIERAERVERDAALRSHRPLVDDLERRSEAVVRTVELALPVVGDIRVDRADPFRNRQARRSTDRRNGRLALGALKRVEVLEDLSTPRRLCRIGVGVVESHLDALVDLYVRARIVRLLVAASGYSQDPRERHEDDRHAAHEV
jgi:hypothetical protein